MRLLASLLLLLFTMPMQAQMLGIELSTSSKRAVRYYQKAESAYLAGNFERAAQLLKCNCRRIMILWKPGYWPAMFMLSLKKICRQGKLLKMPFALKPNYLHQRTIL